MQEELCYDVAQEPIVLSKFLLDKLLETTCPSDSIALYTFYYYTAKWQKTNRVKATNTYVRKGLKWGSDKLTSTKKILEDLGLVENIVDKDSTGKVKGWYVQVNFIWSAQSFQNTQNQEVDSSTSGKQDTNALSRNKENASSVDKESGDSADASSETSIRIEGTDGDVKETKAQKAKREALLSHDNYRTYMKLEETLARDIKEWKSKDFVILFYCGISKTTPNLRELPTWGKDGKLMEQYMFKYGPQRLKDMIIFFFNSHDILEKEVNKELDMSLSTFSTDWIRDKIKLLVVGEEKRKDRIAKAVTITKQADEIAVKKAEELRQKIKEKQRNG